MSALKWLLLGAGDIARKRVAAALRDAAGSELVAVCDVVEQSATDLAAEYGVPGVYSNLGAALAESGADAVYVATPVHLHVQHAVQALDAGRHVLVEKPLGLDFQACEEVLAAAANSGTTAGCAYYRRLFPAYQHARDMLAAGEFGRIVLGRMVYFSWFAPAPDDLKRWRVLRERSGGGPLSDMGTHMFDVLIGLLGMPAKVHARCANLVHDWDVEDTARLSLEMADGALVTGSFGWTSSTWRHEFELVGTEAKVYWHPYDGGQIIKTVGREITKLELPPAANVHLPLVEDFVAAVREGREPACPLSAAADTNALLDAVYRSAATGREVAL
jgi:predicted dehydrogenase